MTSSIKAGFVTKQGHRMKNWLPRYMVLDQSLASLVYYKGQPPFALHEKGRINLIGAAVVDGNVGGSVRPNSFDVVTAAGVHYPIQARDAADRQEWVAAIRAVITAAAHRGEAADAAAYSAAVASQPTPVAPTTATSGGAREVHIDDTALHASLYFPTVIPPSGAPPVSATLASPSSSCALNRPSFSFSSTYPPPPSFFPSLLHTHTLAQ